MLEYLGELTHEAPGFPGPDLAAELLAWVATFPPPTEPYVREEPNPLCFACGGADHTVCRCPEHWEILDRTLKYLGKDPAVLEQLEG